MILEKIKKLCEKEDISIRQLEMDVGLSTGAISKWNKCMPKADSLKSVADRLGTTVEYLLKE